jgi:hypothetical protein
MGGPYCLGGEGACPPEDVGEYRQWLGLVDSENWDAHFCSIRETNKRLSLLA